MNKKELRAEIRAKKRAMTPEEIEARSRRLGELLAGSPAYRAADTIYGYLPYNQEVRTVPMLERALREGKRVAVPKVYGEEMRFIYKNGKADWYVVYEGNGSSAVRAAGKNLFSSDGRKSVRK